MHYKHHHKTAGRAASPCILLVVDHVGDGTVDVHSGDTLPQPLALHVLGGDSPHLQGG